MSAKLSTIFALVFVTSTSLFAQYSGTAFEQKKAAELYDERGFLQNKAITVDGNLVVANSNGNVSYTYPISNWNRNGYPFAVNLNYCGSVPFLTFSEYDQGNEDNPHVGWSRFHQNRPAWIIGINGFAVQALSVSTSFHSDPAAIDGRYNNSSFTTFDDEEFVWAIDGYDVCNRMVNFRVGDFNLVGPDNSPLGTNVSAYRDVIRLLREDGSVLELVNSKRNGETGSDPEGDWDDSKYLYSGYYVVNEVNEPGYAQVEFLDSNEMPYYLFQLLWNTSNSPYYTTSQCPSCRLYNYPQFRPRRVRYYQGDGLEYVFEERVNPFGMQNYVDGTGRYGSMTAGPTIFYLTEIRDAKQRLLEFHYTRHRHADSTTGRALIERIVDNEFNEHYFRWSNSGVALNAMGRTTLIRCDEISYSGNAESGTEMPFADLGYWQSIGGWGTAAQVLSTLPLNNDGLYRSWLGYVGSIIDPEGRETTFDYEQYERRYLNYGWPRTDGGATIKTILKNYRLNQVTEPSAKYSIKYYNRSGGAESFDVDGLDTLTVAAGASTDYPFAFSNSARILEKRSLDPGNPLLRTQRYSFGSFDSRLTTTPNQSVVEVEDNITGHIEKTTYLYDRDSLPDYFNIPYLPNKWHTKLRKVTAEGIENSQTIWSHQTETFYETVAPYLRLPSWELVTENGCRKGLVTFAYGLDTVRRFGENDTLIKYQGSGVRLQETRNFGAYEESSLLLPHTIDTALFLNIPQFDTTVLTTVDTVFDKFEMKRKFDSLRALNDPAIAGIEFRYAMYDPRILTVKWVNTYITTIPPLFGLPVESWTSDRNGNYLQGKKSVFCLLGDCDPGNSSLTWDQQRSIRGALLTDTVFGRGRHQAIAGDVVSYISLQRGRPDKVVNTLGAQSRDYHVYRHPGIPTTENPSGIVLANDDSTYERELLNSTHFASVYEVPLSERDQVRRYHPGLTLLTDTLTTMYERTYFGQISKVVDPNGWLSQYDYDYNGRLNTAWLPYDFQSLDSIYIGEVEGEEKTYGYGSTSWTTHYDTTWCGGSPSSSYHQEVNHTDYSLYCNRPLIIIPKCDGTFDSVSTREVKGPNTQATTSTDRPYIYDSPAKAFLRLPMPPNVEEILSLDSAFVDIYVTTVIGQCVNLKVTLPAYETFEGTYILNCDALNTNQGGGGTGSITTGGEKGSSTQTGTPDTLYGMIHLRVNLVNYLDSLLDDDYLDMFLETSTINGEIQFASGYETSDDAAPTLRLYGEFRKINHLSDYTLHYVYDDENLKSQELAKVDDSLHTSNIGVGGLAALGESRRTSVTHRFGADYQLLSSSTPIGPLNSPSRIDSVRASYNGLGKLLRSYDQVNDSTITRYDAFGRIDTVLNQDGTFSTVDYYTCCYDPVGNEELEIDPSWCYDFTQYDQDFYGFVKTVVTTNELGKKFVKYFDAFDQLRREVADSGGLHLITRYEYDILGRLKTVVNPAGDATSYWYDDFGRIRYKQQPDLGTISYAYDKLGNVRFIQTEEQYEEDRITFNEYDDLNRLTIVGEADFLDHQSTITPTGSQEERSESSLASRVSIPTQPNPGDPEKSTSASRTLSIPTDDTLNLYRITDAIDPNELQDDGFSAILTSNMTLWKSMFPYGKTVPGILGDNEFIDSVSRDCEDMTTLFPDAVGPFLRHKAYSYEPTSEISDYDDFENLAKHPENVRIAINYDRLPDTFGPVWGNFPTYDQWDSLAPNGTVRNLKGREAAVAYREHGGEPFHYTVISYDERGRPEALIHYTENIGFDAIYYSHNSLNQVIAVTVADPLRQFTTWYGYDHNGQVDSVWTKLGEVGTGIGGYLGTPADYPVTSLSRPLDAEITYVYTPTGQVDTMYYPAVDVAVDYRYSPRKWLDTLKATKGGSDLFSEYLIFNAGGQITRQQSQQGGSYPLIQDYTYDGISQLTEWKKQYGGIYGWTREQYAYDPVGNRDSVTYIANGWSTPYPKDYYDNGRGSSTPGVGPNQLLKVTQPSSDYTEYAYDRNGSMTTRQQYTSTNVLTKEERFGYSSWRNLPWSYEREDPTITVGPNLWEYRYRYNAMGEREQKREWLNPSGDGVAPGYEWTYYLLGGAKEQLSLWKGMQTSESGFCGNLWSGSYVYLYPTEYSTYAVEYNAEIEDILRLTTKPDGTKEYYVTDHLASLRVKLDSTGQVLIGNDYTPFGDLLNGQADRRLFNSREKDSEHNLYNNGVRKLDDNAGRFTSIDPLWENFRAWSPYQYGYNEPLSVTDPEGLQGARAYMVNAMDQSYYSPSPGGGGTGRRGGGGTGGLRSFNLGGTIRGAWKAVSSAKVRTSSSRSSGRGTSGSSSKGQGRSKSTSSSNKSGKGGSQSTNGGGSGGNGSGGNGQSSNMGSRQLGELEPIHQRGANKITQTELQKMSDRELMKTVIQPKDGQYLKVREGSNRLLDGNTRVNEMIFRMQQNNPNFTPTLRLPVQVLTP